MYLYQIIQLIFLKSCLSHVLMATLDFCHGGTETYNLALYCSDVAQLYVVNCNPTFDLPLLSVFVMQMW